MYSILIVDDERYMRAGIAKLLPWNSLGIDYVETADSGSNALRRMEEHMPDIVLTDIEMRNMDGLTLIRQMNRMNPWLRIIVLTGHDNFSYVQECCRMEVQDYLLKPVGIDKLAESIRAQVEEVKRIDEAESRKRMQSRIDGLTEQLKVQHTFHEFLKKRTGEEKVRQILRDYGWTNGESFQIAIIAPEQGIDGLSGDIRHELQDISATSACMELVEYNRHGISFRDGSNALVILLFRGSSHFNSRELLEQIRTVLQNEYDTAQRVYLGSVAEQISQIPDSYADAVLLRDSYHRSGVVQIQTEQDRCLLVLNMEPEVRQDLVDNLEDSEQIALIFEDYCLKLESYQLPLSFIRQCCFQLLTGVYYSWSEKHPSAEGPSRTRLMTSIQSSEESGVYEVCRAFLSITAPVASGWTGRHRAPASLRTCSTTMSLLWGLKSPTLSVWVRIFL